MFSLKFCTVASASEAQPMTKDGEQKLQHRHDTRDDTVVGQTQEYISF